MLGLVLPQLVATKTAGKMALRWPRLGFSSYFLQPICLSLQKTSASPLSLSIYLSKYRAPLKFQLYLRGGKRNPVRVAALAHVRKRKPSAKPLLELLGKRYRDWVELGKAVARQPGEMEQKGRTTELRRRLAGRHACSVGQRAASCKRRNPIAPRTCSPP